MQARRTEEALERGYVRKYMACTEKMKRYAEAISKELNISPPNFDSFEATSDFISENKDKYNKYLFNKPIPKKEKRNTPRKYKEGRQSLGETMYVLLGQLYRKHGCYALWNKNEIVYIGKSKNLGQRISQSIIERTKQKDITGVTPVLTRTMADMHILELVLINELKPILNSDTFCRDTSNVFHSKLSVTKLKKYRYTIRKIENCTKFEFIIF